MKKVLMSTVLLIGLAIQGCTPSSDTYGVGEIDSHRIDNSHVDVINVNWGYDILGRAKRIDVYLQSFQDLSAYGKKILIATVSNASGSATFATTTEAPPEKQYRVMIVRGYGDGTPGNASLPVYEKWFHLDDAGTEYVPTKVVSFTDK